jgi:hypothetical protein
MSNRGLLVLLVDQNQRHVAIEAAPAKASELELAVLARDVSQRLGFAMRVYLTMPTRDYPRAIEQARQLLRFSDAKLAA